MALSADEINAYTRFLEILVSSRWYILIILVGTLILGCVFVLFFLRARRLERKSVSDALARAARDEQASKDRRAKLYASSFENLVTVVRDLRTSSDRTSRETVGAIDRFAEIAAKTQRSVEVLSRKIDGRMGREESARFIQSNFTRDFFRDVCAAIERSLRENDYQRRKEFIRNRVKTQMGDLLRDNREYLASFPLSIDVREYFTIHQDQDGERFTLCDDIWASVEPRYTHDAKLEHRIEEAYLSIENAIRDYLVKVYTGLEYGPSQHMSGSRGSFKTPLPGSLKYDGAESGLQTALIASAMPGAAVPGSHTAALLKRRT